MQNTSGQNVRSFIPILQYACAFVRIANVCPTVFPYVSTTMFHHSVDHILSYLLDLVITQVKRHIASSQANIDRAKAREEASEAAKAVQGVPKAKASSGKKKGKEPDIPAVYSCKGLWTEKSHIYVYIY